MTPTWLVPLGWTIWITLTALAIVLAAGTRVEMKKAEADSVRALRLYGMIASAALMLVGLAKALRWLWG